MTDSAPEMVPNAKPLKLPKLATWLFVRGIKLKQAGLLLACSPEAVRRYTLPFDDPARRTPPAAVLERIAGLTGGEITAEDFNPPQDVDA